MEHSEKFSPEDYLKLLEKGLEREAPDLVEKAKEFNREVDEKTFWNEEHLAVRFKRDNFEYQDIIRWIAAACAETRTQGVCIAQDDAAAIDKSFLDALHQDGWGRAAENPDELSHIQARKAILLRGEIIMAGVDPSRLTEARYERWKERRPHYAED